MVAIGQNTAWPSVRVILIDFFLILVMLRNLCTLGHTIHASLLPSVSVVCVSVSNQVQPSDNADINLNMGRFDN